MHWAASIARSATSFGTGIALASGAEPVRTVMKPPACWILSKARPVGDQVLEDGEGPRAERLDRDHVAVLEAAHVRLAARHAAVRAVGLAVDHERAGAADSLAAVVRERDRLLALRGQLVVHDVEHLEEATCPGSGRVAG